MELKTDNVEGRLSKVEQELRDLKEYIKNDMKTDIKELEEKFEDKVRIMENRFQSQFRWTMATLLTIFTIILSLIAMVCIR